MPPALPISERFWSKVEKSDGCWIWTAGTSPFGHGRFNVAGKPRYAHRLVWEWANGPIPEHLVVCHSCDEPRCVRLDHLRLGSRAENIAEARAKGRWHNDSARRKPAVVGPGRSRPLGVRFWEKVEIGAPDECWPWQGTLGTARYGMLWVNDRKRKVVAHRIAYELTYGPIPDGLYVLHSCDNRPCCNPAHLRAGTNADNVADRAERRRVREHRQSGEANANAKLTDRDVAAIRAAVAAGETQQVVASRFGVTQPQVSRIVRGRQRG